MGMTEFRVLHLEKMSDNGRAYSLARTQTIGTTQGHNNRMKLDKRGMKQNINC